MSAAPEQPSLEVRIALLESQMLAINQRNRRVEAAKAWEQSAVRVVAIVSLTYALMCLLFYVLGARNFMLSATVPTLGYYLSTLSLSKIKSLWLKRQARRTEESVTDGN